MVIEDEPIIQESVDMRSKAEKVFPSVLFWRRKSKLLTILLLSFWFFGIFLVDNTPSEVYDTRYDDNLIVAENEKDQQQEENVSVLPGPAEAMSKSFSWKYKGKEYRMDLTLYGSYYRFYQSLPTNVSDIPYRDYERYYEAYDNLFLSSEHGDGLVKEISGRLRSMGTKQKFDDNHMAEFVAAFVQSIPYDQQKADGRDDDIYEEGEKTTYPYEVVYENKGVCQDKSYLAYLLLKELGYGVSIFLFPEPEINHMAVGVQCPRKYSSYDSGYCFLESTNARNRIGVIPDFVPETRMATADMDVTSVDGGQAEESERYRPLGNVYVFNKTEGKEYTGVSGTMATQREIERLRKSIYAQQAVLRKMKAEIDAQKLEVERYEKRLKALDDKGDSEKYDDVYSDYDKLFSGYSKTIKDYNTKVKFENADIDKLKVLQDWFYGG